MINDSFNINPNELDPVTSLCLKIYPNQTNVMQATTQLQYWLNGPDPLDYINIYINNDEENNGLNSHFHYVSLGLTDLYGDERVHKRAKSTEDPSGYGYELTIRIRKDHNEKQAPNWPIKLMQALARYTFSNGGLLDIGDHIPNVLSDSGSRVKHILICEDFQLKTAQTKYGKIKFLQIVGCTDDELKFAQQWSAKKVLEAMKQFKELGHEYLLTDLNRPKSIFDMDSELKRNTLRSIKKDGSYLSFIKSNCFWRLNLETSTHDFEYKPYTQLNFNIDLKTAKLMPTILKQRIEKDNSFIFNGLDGRNLIIVPVKFKHNSCHVTSQFPIKSNGMECQILLNEIAILSLNNYFQGIRIEKQEAIDEPLTEKIYLDEKNEFCMYLKIFSNDKIIEFYENS